VKREGMELSSNFTATINAELRIGAVEETVTVSGASPMVDVQTNTKAQVLSREVLDAVPTAHTIQSVGQLVVGVTLTAPDVGGSQAMQQTYFTVHGLGAAQTAVLMDGMIINGLQGDGAIQSYLNDAGNQEMVYQTGGGNVDSPTGGVKINLVPGQYPDRYNAQGALSYVTGSHAFKAGFEDSWGVFNHTYRMNADLYQNYLNGRPFSVTLYDTPIWSAERLNANLGVYGQDIWTTGRVTFTIGGRWEYVSEAVVGQPSQHGRFANVPAFGDIRMPVWKTFSPRTAAVVDLFGTGRTAARVGYNRFEAAATTTLASLYNPSAVLTASASWTDLDLDDVAEGARGCVYLTPGCEINFAQVPTNFGGVCRCSGVPLTAWPHERRLSAIVT
jgi:hypothetical protein